MSENSETISMNWNDSFVEILRDDTKTYSITYSVQELKKILDKLHSRGEEMKKDIQEMNEIYSRDE